MKACRNSRESALLVVVLTLFSPLIDSAIITFPLHYDEDPVKLVLTVSIDGTKTTEELSEKMLMFPPGTKAPIRNARDNAEIVVDSATAVSQLANTPVRIDSFDGSDLAPRIQNIVKRLYGMGPGAKRPRFDISLAHNGEPQIKINGQLMTNLAGWYGAATGHHSDAYKRDPRYKKKKKLAKRWMWTGVGAGIGFMPPLALAAVGGYKYYMRRLKKKAKKRHQNGGHGAE